MTENSAVETLARTIAGEIGAGGREGWQSVANVVMNRAKHPRWWGDDVVSVCLKREQFSCWLPGPDRDRIRGLTIEYLARSGIWRVANDAVAGRLEDITDGADHYFATSAPVPSWADPRKFTKTIAGQAFYRLELPAPAETAAARWPDHNTWTNT